MTCAKKKVSCIIETSDGLQRFFGTNDCGNPQKTCPRAPGEGYEKCKSICEQAGHAEEIAIQLAIGHYCRDCQDKLFAAGVESLRLMKK